MPPTPNPYPDVIGKVAFDPKTGKTHQHIEAAALIRGFKTYSAASDSSFSATGRGVSVNANLEPVKGLHLIATTFFSNGGGRYIGGLAPDFIVNADGSIALVRLEVGDRRGGTAGAAEHAGLRLLRHHPHRSGDRARRRQVDRLRHRRRHRRQPTIDETTIGVSQTFFREPRYGATAADRRSAGYRHADAVVGAGGRAGLRAHAHGLYRRPLRAAVGASLDGVGVAPAR